MQGVMGREGRQQKDRQKRHERAARRVISGLRRAIWMGRFGALAANDEIDESEV